VQNPERTLVTPAGDLERYVDADEDNDNDETLVVSSRQDVQDALAQIRPVTRDSGHRPAVGSGAIAVPAPMPAVPTPVANETSGRAAQEPPRRPSGRSPAERPSLPFAAVPAPTPTIERVPLPPVVAPPQVAPVPEPSATSSHLAMTLVGPAPLLHVPGHTSTTPRPTAPGVGSGPLAAQQLPPANFGWDTPVAPILPSGAHPLAADPADYRIHSSGKWIVLSLVLALVVVAVIVTMSQI
jgi:hypothetical protein